MSSHPGEVNVNLQLTSVSLLINEMKGSEGSISSFENTFFKTPIIKIIITITIEI